jgi:hypothetical protein
VTTALQSRLSSLRDSLFVLRTLENKDLPMNAADYQFAARHLSNELQGHGLTELVVIARSMFPVLSQAAENILYERDADNCLGDAEWRDHAREATLALLSRM